MPGGEKLSLSSWTPPPPPPLAPLPLAVGSGATTATSTTSSPSIQECQQQQKAWWAGPLRSTVDPGAAEQVPVIVARVLRRVLAHGADTFAQGISFVDIGANKGAYSPVDPETHRKLCCPTALTPVAVLA